MRRVNIASPEFEYDPTDPEGFKAGMVRPGPELGATKLGASVYVLPPGQALCPYHYELTEEEWLLVLEGRPTVRLPEGTEQLEQWDLMCFATGAEGAHSVRNDTDKTVRVLMFSNVEDPAVTVYPDSDKVGVYTKDKRDDLITTRSSAVDSGTERPGMERPAPMSSAQYYCAASLDGYIAEADDTLEWLMKYEGSFAGEGVTPMEGSYDRFYDGVGALVMGSATYEFVLAHDGRDKWPYEGKPSWVLTSRDLPVHKGAGAGVRFADAAVADLYAEMMAAAGERNLWVVGGGNVASQFADAGLLDEVLVTVVPVVLGSGKPLFDRRLPGGAMQLTGTRTFDTGMVELSYAVRRSQV